MTRRTTAAALGTVVATATALVAGLIWLGPPWGSGERASPGPTERPSEFAVASTDRSAEPSPVWLIEPTVEPQTESFQATPPAPASPTKFASPSLKPPPASSPKPSPTDTPDLPGCGAGAEATSSAQPRPTVPTIQPGQFARAAAIPPGGAYESPVLLSNGMVLLVGRGHPELYDPATNTYSPAGPMTDERAEPIVTTLRDGRVLIIGGSGFRGCAVGNIDSVEIYDPATNTFRLLMEELGFDLQSASLLPDGGLLLVGGTAAALFDPETMRMTEIGGDVRPAQGASAVTLRDASVLFVGGAVASGGRYAAVNTAVIFDPKASAFRAIAATMAFPRTSPAVTLLSNGRVLIAGSRSTDYPAPACSDACARSVEIYDPETGTFSLTGTMNVGRDLPTATLLPNGDVLMVGGVVEIGAGRVAEVWSDGTFHQVGLTADSLLDPDALALRDGRVFLAGMGSGGGHAELYQP